MRIPKYRRRPDRDYAFVEWNGDRIPLPGSKDSPESIAAYHDFIAKISAEEAKQSKASHVASLNIRRRGHASVRELVGAYLDFARVYYGPESRGEYSNMKQAARPLTRVFGDTRIQSFGPMCLISLQDALVSGSWARPKELRKPWTRRYINAVVRRVVRIFRWGVSRELVPAAIVTAMDSVEPLRQGKTKAREKPKVGSVASEHVEAVLPFMSPVLAAMVRIHQLTGMRSDNLTALRWADIDRSGDVWVYRPPKWKSKWRHEDQDTDQNRLLVMLGPRSQAILQAFLHRPLDAFIFSPEESEAHRKAVNHAARKTPKWKSHVNKPSRAQSGSPRQHAPRYTTGTYRQAVSYAIDRANKARLAEDGKQDLIPHWHPHQLRHRVATFVRDQYGIEGAQVYLGHANADVTQIYTDRNLDQARRIAREVG